MKLTVQKKYLSELPENFIRQKASYAHIHSHHTGHDSYVRRLSRDHYPRLHMYIKDIGDSVIFDLHLDQKQTSYQGARSHNAEHSGAVVEAEMARLKDLLRQNMPGASGAVSVNQSSSETKLEKRVGHGDFRKDSLNVEKKGFWKKIFS